MEATTIEEAVSLITEPPKAAKAEAAEAVEVGEAEVIDEPTEAEELTQEFESDDDDVDYDEVDLEDYEEETQPQLITVKSDGKEKQVTLDELKQGYAGQDYIQRRMQEVAQLEKEFKTQAQHLAQQQQQFLQLQQQAQQVGMQPPEAPSRELFDRDPIGYMEAKMEYDEAVVQYNQYVGQVREIQQQQQVMTEQQRQQFLAQQAEILKQHLPEIADPERGEKLKADLIKTGTHYGFTEAEIQGVTDARYVRALNDAMKWRRLQQKKQDAVQGEQPKSVIKAGAKRRAGDGEAAARKKAQQTLRKTGRIEDALSLMLKP